MSNDASRVDSGQPRRLTSKQEAVLDALAAGKSAAEAAQLAGVSRPTIFRWKRIPGFAAALEGRETTFRAELIRRLNAMRAPALNVIQAALAGGDKRAALTAAALVVRSTGLNTEDAPEAAKFFQVVGIYDRENPPPPGVKILIPDNNRGDGPPR